MVDKKIDHCCKLNNNLKIDHSQEFLYHQLTLNLTNVEATEYEILNDKEIACVSEGWWYGQVNVTIDDEIVFSRTFGFDYTDLNSQDVLKNCKTLVSLARKNNILIIDYSRDFLLTQISLNK